MTYVQLALGWLIRLAMIVAAIVIAWWFITHPEQVANLIVTVVSGVKTFVQTLINGISKLL